MLVVSGLVGDDVTQSLIMAFRQNTRLSFALS